MQKNRERLAARILPQGQLILLGRGLAVRQGRTGGKGKVGEYYWLFAFSAGLTRIDLSKDVFVVGLSKIVFIHRNHKLSNFNKYRKHKSSMLL